MQNRSVGGQTYVITVDANMEEYQNTLQTVEQKGFVKYVDNCEGFSKEVLSTTYVRELLVLTVIYFVKQSQIQISVSENLPLSEHLYYEDVYVANNRQGAKTVLHMPELFLYGNSFIIQLKNGHFVMNDGGMREDVLYLFDYLESLAPKGEKPVIEGWFISHGHGDHVGVFYDLLKNPKEAERVCVEGFYFSEPDYTICEKFQTEKQVEFGVAGMKLFRTQEGKIPEIYRPQTGQRYYFNDITIDVLHTQEQLPEECYNGGFNDSSTWLMYTIEGQKVMLCGDAAKGSVEWVKSIYNQEDFKVDILATFHHGQNVYSSYVDYFSYKTVLYTTFVVGSQTKGHREEANARMQENAEECVSWGDGTKVLTFPYRVGEAESVPLRRWSYHPDRETPTPF